MARIYKRTDRIVVKIDDVTLKLAPLTLAQKSEVQQALLLGHTKSDLREATRGVALAIKYSVKTIEGVVDTDGNPYQLEMSDGELTDACVDDLMNMELLDKLALVCSSFAKGVPTEFKDIDGVELVKPPKATDLKNG